MSRRVNLPGASELFGGSTAEPSPPTKPSTKRPVTRPAGPSGRVRHDEKITVYVSTEELVSLEHARLALRAEHGINVDRGRLVREAIDMLIEDFEAQGDSSAVVQRLLR